MYFFYVLKMYILLKKKILRNIVLNVCQKYVVTNRVWVCKFLVLVCASPPRGSVGQHYPAAYILHTSLWSLRKTLDIHHSSSYVYNQNHHSDYKNKKFEKNLFFSFFQINSGQDVIDLYCNHECKVEQVGDRTITCILTMHVWHIYALYIVNTVM